MSWFTATSPSHRWATALTALAAASALPAHAQSSPKRVHADDPNASVVARAEESTGRPDSEATLTGDAELTRGATRMTARTACFKQGEAEVSATGNVFMWRFGDFYTGDELKLNLSSGK